MTPRQRPRRPTLRIGRSMSDEDRRSRVIYEASYATPLIGMLVESLLGAIERIDAEEASELCALLDVELVGRNHIPRSSLLDGPLVLPVPEYVPPAQWDLHALVVDSLARGLPLYPADDDEEHAYRRALEAMYRDVVDGMLFDALVSAIARTDVVELALAVARVLDRDAANIRGMLGERRRVADNLRYELGGARSLFSTGPQRRLLRHARAMLLDDGLDRFERLATRARRAAAALGDRTVGGDVDRALRAYQLGDGLATAAANREIEVVDARAIARRVAWTPGDAEVQSLVVLGRARIEHLIDGESWGTLPGLVLGSDRPAELGKRWAIYFNPLDTQLVRVELPEGL